LRRTLSVLNAGLGPGALTIDRAAVDLGSDGAEVDLVRFRDALRIARDHGHRADRPCDQCRKALETALALDRGGFMDGFALRDSEPFDEWLLAEREAHGRELAGALERLARERLGAGAPAEAIVAGRRWLELDQLHEPAHRLLMQSYAATGETAAAIRQYRDCVRTLEREIGVAPLPETTQLYEAIRDGGTSVTASIDVDLPTAPSIQRARWPLIGRDRELALAMAVVERTRSDGTVLAIEGDAGIGKTRLADAVAEAVRMAGGSVITATAYAGESDLAFGPIVSLLRSGIAGRGAEALPSGAAMELARIVPELRSGAERRGGDDGPAARHRLLDAIAAGLTALTAGPTLGLIRIEDLQWADVSSLDALGYIARRLARRPAILLLTFRREDLDDRTARRVEGLVAVAGATSIRLERLDDADARALARAAWVADQTPDDDALDVLVREAEGLPLYLVEAASAGAAGHEMPPGVRALLAGRLASLGELARQVAAAGAILGHDFDVERVRATSGRSEDETVVALEELVHRGLVRERHVGGTADYDFTHARQREIAEESASLARRRLLHSRAADALRSGSRTMGRPDDPPHARLARVARHAREAGREAEAADALREAGDLARAVFANREALAHYEAALAYGHPDVAGLRELVGELRMRTGDYAGAIQAFEAAAAAAGPDRLSEIEHRLGRVHLRRGDLPAAESHLAAALATLPSEAAPVERVRMLVDRAIVAHRAGAMSQAKRLASDAVVIASRSSEPLAVAEAERVRGLLARAAGDATTARSAILSSLAAAGEADDRSAVVAARNALALVLGDAGETEAAVDAAQAALSLAREIGDRHLEAAVGNNLADILHAAGRSDEAMVRLKEAVAAFADVAAMGGDGGLEVSKLEPGIWMLESW
jgi:DNA-binding SARP family transcriptional activator/Tfp pilus assembly protein PilF